VDLVNFLVEIKRSDYIEPFVEYIRESYVEVHNTLKLRYEEYECMDVL